MTAIKAKHNNASQLIVMHKQHTCRNHQIFGAEQSLVLARRRAALLKVAMDVRRAERAPVVEVVEG